MDISVLGVTPIPEDEFIPNGLARLVLCNVDNTSIHPVYLSGAQWDFCYWIWRLSDDEGLTLKSALAEIVQELL